MRHLLHLAGRLYGNLRGRPLTPGEQAEVARLLRAQERSLFWRQAPPDQRHAFTCARRVLRAAPSRQDLARAALLHDVGKGIERTTVAGRVLATVLSLLRLPIPGRLRHYLMHASRGAEGLAAAGAERLVVDYAYHHHGPRPRSIPAVDWELLREADRS
jgi:hypothetical protein